MKQQRKLLGVTLLCLLGMLAHAQTETGDSSIGFNLGYGFDSENATMGFDYRYNLTDEIRLAPSMTWFIKNNGLKCFAIDVNAHYVIKLTEMVGFYPLAGVDLAFWNHSNTRFGVNLGLGGELYATDKISLGLEIKYNVVKNFNQALIGLRLGYNF